MSFASLAYLLFLPVVFGLYHLSPGRRLQNAVLLGASCVFYGWWDWRFCGLMLGAATADYVLVLGMGTGMSRVRRRVCLGLSLTVNLGLLGFFKYFNFFADSLVILAAMVGLEVDAVTLGVVLPVGISFYTFQTLSYVIDVYRGRLEASRDLLAYLTYVCFFPQLVAGPIERATDLLPQFLRDRVFCGAAAGEGCRFLLWGLMKKMLLADNLGAIVEGTYANPAQMSAAALAMATLAFSAQIYLDFSAYSDIAVGSARLFGVRLSRNFAYPYFSQSLGEFWRRWHISLSTWFRDYVFIPLGGSRGTLGLTLRNLVVTAFLSGLWHGAAWHFAAWGLMHGLGLAVERFVGHRTIAVGSPAGEGWIPSAAVAWRVFRTFTLVTVGWVFFRAASLADAGHILRTVAAGVVAPGFYGDLGSIVRANLGLWVGLLVFGLWEWSNRGAWMPLALARWPRAVRWAGYTVLVWLTLMFGTRQVAEFIYFQF